MSKLRAILVDDERLARKKLGAMLAHYPQISLIGEADSVQGAVELIEVFSPDVVFLDIQMPGESGFELFDKVNSAFQTIFVTAFDEFAIRAFEINALDYLLKPVTQTRLARSIERLTNANLEPEPTKKALEYDDHLFLEIEKRSCFLRLSAIKCIMAVGAYTEIVTANGQKAVVLKSLKDWEERLPAKHFLRIHRSTIINIEYVDRLEEWFSYSYRVFLRDLETPFVMSRRYTAKLKDRMR